MSKSPHTPEWKMTRVKKYLSGEGSYENHFLSFFYPSGISKAGTGGFSRPAWHSSSRKEKRM